MLTQEELKSKLHYDPDTGLFTWIINPSTKIKIGSIAGRTNMYGYVEITINKKTYKAHRLAWLYMYGEFPNSPLDHINCIKNDNKIFNLRKATYQENNFNKGLMSSNTSGYKNISYDKKNKKWQVMVSVNKKLKYFGRFDDIELALLVAIEARNKYHGEFVNHAEA